MRIFRVANGNSLPLSSNQALPAAMRRRPPMSDRAPRTCSRCGEEGHDIRTCEAPFAISSRRSSGGECHEDCLYELGGMYCPECHRGD